MPFLEEIKSLIVGPPPLPSESQVQLSAAASIPSGEGPLVTIMQTGGYLARRTHNYVGASYLQPTAQVIVRAKDLYVARQVLRAIYASLDPVRNQYVGATTVSAIFITRTGSVATVTAAGHPFVMGQHIQIAGATQPEYNGTFPITYINTHSFSYPVTGAPASPATGTITATYPGTWYVEIEPQYEMYDLGIDSNGRSRVVMNLRAMKSPS